MADTAETYKVFLLRASVEIVKSRWDKAKLTHNGKEKTLTLEKACDLLLKTFEGAYVDVWPSGGDKRRKTLATALRNLKARKRVTKKQLELLESLTKIFYR